MDPYTTLVQLKFIASTALSLKGSIESLKLNKEKCRLLVNNLIVVGESIMQITELTEESKPSIEAVRNIQEVIERAKEFVEKSRSRPFYKKVWDFFNYADVSASFVQLNVDLDQAVTRLNFDIHLHSLKSHQKMQACIAQDLQELKADFESYLSNGEPAAAQEEGQEGEGDEQEQLTSSMLSTLMSSFKLQLFSLHFKADNITSLLQLLDQRYAQTLVDIGLTHEDLDEIRDGLAEFYAQQNSMQLLEGEQLTLATHYIERRLIFPAAKMLIELESIFNTEDDETPETEADTDNEDSEDSEADGAGETKGEEKKEEEEEENTQLHEIALNPAMHELTWSINTYRTYNYHFLPGEREREREYATLNEIDATSDAERPAENTDATQQIPEPIYSLGIVAPAGGGKSTIAQRYCDRWARGKCWQTRFDWVFLIPIKMLEKTNFTTVQEVLHYCIFSKPPFNFSIKQVEDFWLCIKDRPGRILCIFDSLEDLTDQSKPVIEIMLSLEVTKVATFRDTYPVIDMRFDLIVQVDMLDCEDIQQYIYQYFNPNHENEGTDESSELIKFLNEAHELRKDCQLPITLSNICRLWEERKKNLLFDEGNTAIIDLYEEIFKLLVKRYLAKSTPSLFLPSNIRNLRDRANDEGPILLKRFMSRIAFQLSLSGKTVIGRELLEAAQQTLNANIEQSQQLTINSGVMREFCEAGFFRQNQGNPDNRDHQYEFLHANLQRQLTVNFIVDAFKVGLRNPRTRDDITTYFALNKFNEDHRKIFADTAYRLRDDIGALNHFFECLLRPPRDLAGLSELLLMLDCLGACGTSANLNTGQDILGYAGKWLYRLFIDVEWDFTTPILKQPDSVSSLVNTLIKWPLLTESITFESRRGLVAILIGIIIPSYQNTVTDQPELNPDARVIKDHQENVLSLLCSIKLSSPAQQQELVEIITALFKSTDTTHHQFASELYHHCKLSKKQKSSILETGSHVVDTLDFWKVDEPLLLGMEVPADTTTPSPQALSRSLLPQWLLPRSATRRSTLARADSISSEVSSTSSSSSSSSSSSMSSERSTTSEPTTHQYRQTNIPIRRRKFPFHHYLLYFHRRPVGWETYRHRPRGHLSLHRHRRVDPSSININSLHQLTHPKHQPNVLRGCQFSPQIIPDIIDFIEQHNVTTDLLYQSACSLLVNPFLLSAIEAMDMPSRLEMKIRLVQVALVIYQTEKSYLEKLKSLLTNLTVHPDESREVFSVVETWANSEDKRTQYAALVLCKRITTIDDDAFLKAAAWIYEIKPSKLYFRSLGYFTRNRPIFYEIGVHIIQVVNLSHAHQEQQTKLKHELTFRQLPRFDNSGELFTQAGGNIDTTMQRVLDGAHRSELIPSVVIAFLKLPIEIERKLALVSQLAQQRKQLSAVDRLPISEEQIEALVNSARELARDHPNPKSVLIALFSNIQLSPPKALSTRLNNDNHHPSLVAVIHDQTKSNNLAATVHFIMQIPSGFPIPHVTGLFEELISLILSSFNSLQRNEAKAILCRLNQLSLNHEAIRQSIINYFSLITATPVIKPPIKDWLLRQHKVEKFSPAHMELICNVVVALDEDYHFTPPSLSEQFVNMFPFINLLRRRPTPQSPVKKFISTFSREHQMPTASFLSLPFSQAQLETLVRTFVNHQHTAPDIAKMLCHPKLFPIFLRECHMRIPGDSDKTAILNQYLSQNPLDSITRDGNTFYLQHGQNRFEFESSDPDALQHYLLSIRTIKTALAAHPAWYQTAASTWQSVPNALVEREPTREAAMRLG